MKGHMAIRSPLQKGEPRPVRLCMMVTHKALEEAAEDLYAARGKPEM